MTPRDVAHLMRQLGGRIALAIGRAELRLVDDAAALQRLQIEALPGEVRDQVERVQSYGFTGVPKPGADVVILAVGGNRDHPLAIAVDDRRYRLRGLRAGEVAIYDDLGQCVHLTRDGIVVKGAGKPIVIQDTPSLTVAATAQIVFDTPVVRFTGRFEVQNTSGAAQAVTVAGTLNATTDVIGGGISLKGHRHSGVQAGPANTGFPV